MLMRIMVIIRGGLASYKLPPGLAWVMVLIEKCVAVSNWIIIVSRKRNFFLFHDTGGAPSSLLLRCCSVAAVGRVCLLS